jgi:hypothetical protein
MYAGLYTGKEKVEKAFVHQQELVRNRTPTEHQSPVPAALQPPSAPAQTHDPLLIADSSPLPAFAAGQSQKKSMEGKNAALWAQECTASSPFSRQRSEFIQAVSCIARGRTGRDEFGRRC